MIAAQLATAGLDPRMAAVRADLADAALRTVVAVPRYAQPERMACALAFTALLDAPDGEQSSELLNGEHFMQLDANHGWAWGYSALDHYVGYCRADALGPACDVAPVSHAKDPVSFAHQFLDMPYVWGGRGGAGIDCSGLVQRSMAAIGVAALRDSDMQRETLGEALPEGATMHCGDVVFFPGHVGMMVDAEQLIHATRYHMKTLVEPLATVVARVIRKHGLGILARKRVKW
ncbi:MAG: hypothetical protein RL367_1331 [Pseudomonadota bacterium]